ncbi:hypothetical protein CMT19_16790 [Elizabethkingia anophelis]|nr:hypothetical protein [Elizabethkingia anophelis]
MKQCYLSVYHIDSIIGKQKLNIREKPLDEASRDIDILRDLAAGLNFLADLYEPRTIMQCYYLY